MNQSIESPVTGTILVADDEPANYRILEEYLSECGFDVVTASNGQKALELATAHPPDLILLDVVMPGINGFETCRRLKAQESTAAIPVIFTTSLTRTAEKVKGFRAGAVDYITKPFQLEEVLARVTAHLTIRALQTSLQVQNEKLQQEILERRRVEAALRRSQKQSEQLLLNILPQGIVTRLKENPGTIAHQYDEVTVLFADIVDFSRLSAHLTPAELISLLNDIFSIFDELADRHDLEKIKTIGDAYLVVGGLPLPRPDHAQAIASMALDMHLAIREFKTRDGEPFAMRLGINTGPVMAGIIGRKKFSYDLWGNTVNIASRMASLGLSGHTQVTQTTYDRLCGEFTFSERGIIDVKGKGEMNTYLLVDRDPPLHGDKV
jgi:class 3 adenylate cyclase